MKQRKIIIIGGGAAGLMAAGQAAELGAHVLLLEKMKRPGRKLCISGKGRCNLTNSSDLPIFIKHFGKNGNFLRQTFNNFFTPELLDFFQSKNLELTTERGGRIFPKSGKAPDVLKVFLQWLAGLQVEIRCGTPVLALHTHEGVITGVETQKERITGDAVILATGGASYPATGSTGDGYRLAQSIGHSLTPIRPSLIPLVTSRSHAKNLAGLSLRNIAVRLYINSKKKNKASGELAFTADGLSGPIILTLSGEVVDALQNKDTVHLSIDLKPALDDHKLDARLLRDFQKRYQEPIDSILRGLLPKQLIQACLEATHIPADKKGGAILAKERKRLRVWLKNYRIDIVNYRPIEEAIVTAGGVHVKEINPKTMESKIIKGLYIVGELLDIHADTGGYNLQAAFSTGWLAGRSAT